MFKQKNESKKEMKQIVKSILTSPLLSPIDQLSLEKLSILIKKSHNA